MDHEGEEKCTLIYFFNELKVPTSYCANPKRLVNMRELKFNYGCMKAHNCHVIMTQLLPVALCGMLPPKGWCSNHKAVLVLQRDLTKGHSCVHVGPATAGHSRSSYRLEMHFPPTYFDISVHLLVHPIDQIRALGPMYLHQMFPFERLMQV
jgi:hypothetical protein